MIEIINAMSDFSNDVVITNSRMKVTLFTTQNVFGHKKPGLSTDKPGISTENLGFSTINLDYCSKTWNVAVNHH